MVIKNINFSDVDSHMSWNELTDALIAGHKLPKAQIKDVVLSRYEDTLLSRVAWIDGLGQLVKTATIFPGNTEKGCPAINGAVSLFSDKSGELEAIIDFHLVTKWKTAADSLLSTKKLARKNSKNILLVGSGTVSASMLDAYSSLFPKASFFVWGRTFKNALKFQKTYGAIFEPNLKKGVKNADIICSATMSKDPLIKGKWLQPGQHLDLIGAYKADMREVDDLALKKSLIFVDSYETTLNHIGELKIPLEAGVIRKKDIISDFYDLSKFKRISDSDITIAKNGGGAHLDLITAKYIFEKWSNNDQA